MRLREEVHTDDPARRIYVERDGGLTFISVGNVGDLQPWSRVVLEDSEARSVATVINQHFPSPSEDSKLVPMLWVSVLINIILCLWLLNTLT